MGLRPARTVRYAMGQVWARISQKKPRKSYVKGAPRPKVRQYHMGSDKYYELEMHLVPATDVQIRDNSLESARQAANKYLEKKLISNYYFHLAKYPHLVLREHSALGVAGADRISKGMKRAFGRPKGRLARILAGELIFLVRCMRKDSQVVKKALKRAELKMSGKLKVTVKDITQEPWNLAKQGREAKVYASKEVKEEKPAEAAETETAEAASPEEGKAEKAEEKKAEKK